MANKDYVAIETALLFADSAQTPDTQITLTALAAGAGRVSARKDLTASSHSRLYEWRAVVQFATAPVVGEAVHLYIATSDGTEEDGQVGTADAALGSANDLLNLHYIGSLVVTSTDATHDMTASGTFEVNARYFSLVVFNDTADAFVTGTTTHSVWITPVPGELQ